MSEGKIWTNILALFYFHAEYGSSVVVDGRKDKKTEGGKETE